VVDEVCLLDPEDVALASEGGVTHDPLKGASISELERLASDYSDPATQIRASQRLTEITAARITNREKPFFRRLRIGSDVVLLDSHDQTELENWLAHGQALIKACLDHKRERCDCWQPIRDYVWQLQRTKPGAAITKAADLLWDSIAEFARHYERPKQLDPVVAALVHLAESREARDSEFPTWLGKRRPR
jgi:hypothetical protein